MPVQVDVSTLELDRQLRKLVDHADPHRLGIALSAGAVSIVNTAKRRVHVISGDLRESIEASKPFDDGDYISVIIGSDLPYAAIEELGGEIRVTPKMRAYLHYIGIHLRSTTQVIKRDPHPYLRPAYEQELSNVIRIIAATLRRVLFQ